MKPTTIFVAGSGKIGRAVAHLLREVDAKETGGCSIVLGDKCRAQAEDAKRWVLSGSRSRGALDVAVMADVTSTHNGGGEHLQRCYREADILLDCLPGHLAPSVAAIALRHRMHYVNVTEYVEETAKIRAKAKNSEKGFLLQTGLAPGYINVLALDLFETFCERYSTNRADHMKLRVGALTRHAEPPHFYGFTWSSAGVATEYIKPATALRNGKKVEIDSLSERETIVIDGTPYEEALTSGGVANLCDFMEGRVQHLDYKTLRHPGHYEWVEGLLAGHPTGNDTVAFLQAEMERAVPNTEDDLVAIYVSVKGYDDQGLLRQLSTTRIVRPTRIGHRTLTAIQATTAAGLAESTRLLLAGRQNGIVLQSDIPRKEFLNGPFVSQVYNGNDYEV